MNDKMNELSQGGDGSSEALSRVERIKAIKNSIRSNPQASESDIPVTEGVSDNENSETIAETAEESVPDNTADSGWEDDIAARIAKRVQKVKDSKNDAVSKAAEDVPNEPEGEEDEEAENTEQMPEEPAEDETVEPEEAAAETDDANIPQTAETPKKKKIKKKKKPKTLKESLLGLLPQKKDSAGERVRKIIFLGSCTAIIVCGYIVADYYIDNAMTKKGYDDIAVIYNRTEVPPEESEYVEEIGQTYELLPGAANLLEINSDVAGYINIPGTEVNYPFVQSDDLEKYLNMNIMGEEAKAGALFLDYRNRFDYVVDGKLAEQDSDNLIIYGHNMENGMMFGTLKNYRNNADYYEAHPIIELNSNYACYTYKIFAFFIIDSDDTSETAFECWNYLNFHDEESFYNFVNEAKRRTLRLNDVDVRYGDKLLTLSTCNGIFGTSGPGRLIVLARRVRDGEDPYEGTQNSIANPNIKWPTLYYKYKKNEKYDPNAEFIPYPYSDTPAEETTTTTEE